MRSFWIAVFGLAATVFGAGIHTQVPGGGSVVRLDPALDAVVSVQAKLEVLKEDYFGFLEGPVWVPEKPGGYLLFSDFAANAIYKWTPEGELSVFLQKSGFSGTDLTDVGVVNNGRLTVATFGSNGLALDAQGRLIICTHGDRTLVRLEKDGTRTILADKFEGKRLNGPNDVAVRSDGAIYFSDRGSGIRAGDKNPTKELAFRGLFLLKDGKLQLLEKEDAQAQSSNGMAFTPDERALYVVFGPRIVRYDVRADGTLANSRLFVDMSIERGGVPDGIKVDAKGNVYSPGPSGVWVLSPEGKHLGTIRVSEPVSNLAFGDADLKSLYITGRRSLYKLRVNTPGGR